MNKELRKGLRTWIEIDKGAIKHNFSVFRGLITKNTKLLGVVKSNAYGHNLFEFAKELEKLGVDFLGVDSAVEALALRREGVKAPILVLGFTLPEMFEELAQKNISVTISNFETLNVLKNIKQKINIHVKVDTGMSRHGFVEKEIKKVLSEIEKINNRPRHQNDTPSSTHEGDRSKPMVTVGGLFTHFAMAKNPSFPGYTKIQIEKFNIWQEAFKKAGLKPICHAGATAGSLLFNDAHFDMIRVGIGLYGIWPSKEAQAFYGNKIKLQPVLTWRTLIAEIKNFPKGTKVGYDCSETLSKDSVIAVCPVGYWHGLPRALSSIGNVLVNGKKCKIIGRVCMDIIMIDITDVGPVKTLDEVTIIGRDGKPARNAKAGGAEITADEISGLLDGSTYELLTRINPLIKRIYLDK
jgi:alanine racemase